MMPRGSFWPMRARDCCTSSADGDMDQPGALRPLLEAADDIRRLEDYDTPDDLSSAITAVVGAMDRALRLRLRNDPGASEEHRLNALAPDRLPLSDVVRALRSRESISLETAGTVHQARAAADRAAAGEARAADGDVVRDAVDRLRRELESGPGRTSGGSPAGAAEAAATPSAPVDSDPDATDGAVVERWPTSRWMRWTAAAFAAVIVLGAAWVTTRGGSADFDDAIAAFRAGRTDSAAAAFERVVEDQPRNVTALLYLARSYRRVDRPAEAADALRRALRIEPEDGDVRRELGHLFMDLERPASAVAQYERALEYEPDNPRNWAALIRALRQIGDPGAELLLRDAPPDVQAVLRGEAAAP